MVLIHKIFLKTGWLNGRKDCGVEDLNEGMKE
jgi:hypothetical protein